VAFSFLEGEYCTSRNDSVSPPGGKRHSFCRLNVTGIAHLPRRTRCPYNAYPLAIHNHSLDEMDYNEKELATMHRSLWMFFAGLALFFLPKGTGTKLVLVAVGLGYRWYRGISGRNQLIRSGKLLQMAGV